jgi:primary-amine oxidase
VQIDDLPIHNDFTVKQGETTKIPAATSNYDPDILPENFLRKNLKPLAVNQPDGPSFIVNGNEISWQKFKIRIGFVFFN